MFLSPWARVAIGVWAVVVVAVCVKPLFKPVSGTVFVTYSTAGREFAAGGRLYDVSHPHTDNFRYSPLVAAGFVPFSWLPLSVGGALWRVVSIAVFVTGLFAWARRVCPEVPRPWFFLAALPLSLQSLNNGQANTLMVGLMLWATILAARNRWAAAAVLIAGAAIFKGYPIALGGLFLLLAPIRFGVPLLVSIAAGLALPYAFQSQEYVTEQYRYWLANLARDDRTSLPLWAGYQDFHMLLRVIGLSVSRSEFAFVQAGASLLAAGIVLWHRLRNADRLATQSAAFTLGICWMTLFAPAVETATFIIFAPVLARELLDSAHRPRWAQAAAIAGAGLFLTAIVALMFPHAIHRPVIALGVQPLGALFVSLAAIGRIFAARQATPAVTAALASEPVVRRAA